MTLRDTIFEELRAAPANGYFMPGEQLDGATEEEIAKDLLAFSPACEELTEEQILPHVRDWLVENPPPK